MELIFNPCSEFQWGPEGPVSQFHSHHLHVGTPGIFSDHLRPVQMLKRESGVRKATESYRTYSIAGKTAMLVLRYSGRPAFGQNCSLGTCSCSEGPAFGQNTHDYDDDDDDDDDNK